MQKALNPFSCEFEAPIIQLVKRWASELAVTHFIPARGEVLNYF